VWFHLPNERFSKERKSKIFPRRNNPFQIIERINDNACKDLPCKYGVSIVYYVSDLSHLMVGDDLRTNPSQKDGNDEEMNTSKST